jgi:hypothetical protein
VEGSGRPSAPIALTDAGPTVLRAGALDAATLRAAWDELSAASV